VEQIIASQTSRELRLKAADWVIYNVALTHDELAREVTQMSCHFKL
jgi:hypothetical protein